MYISGIDIFQKRYSNIYPLISTCVQKFAKLRNEKISISENLWRIWITESFEMDRKNFFNVETGYDLASIVNN